MITPTNKASTRRHQCHVGDAGLLRRDERRRGRRVQRDGQRWQLAAAAPRGRAAPRRLLVQVRRLREVPLRLRQPDRARLLVVDKFDVTNDRSVARAETLVRTQG